MARCSARTTSDEAHQCKDTKILDDSVSGDDTCGDEPQPSGKTAPPSISSTSAPGAYAIPGIDAANYRNEHNRETPLQMEESPIDAFVADEPVAAVEWGGADQQVVE